MTETWLRPNRRVLLLAAFPVAAIGAAGGAIMGSGWGWWAWALGGSVSIGAGWAMLLLAIQMFRPRISFNGEEVCFHLGSIKPHAVPLRHVEAFFLGQSPSGVPEAPGKQGEAVNLIARLSRKAPEWESQAVKPALGRWCDGYVTIRGAWCEPLSGATVGRLNRRLAELSRAAKEEPDARVEA
ncbi:MAG: hypothetical protein AAGA92_03070 [Planctomycetota bacterium]